MRLRARPGPLALRFAAPVALAALLAGCGAPRGDETAMGFGSFEPDSMPDAYTGGGGALLAPGASRAFWVDPEGNLYDGEMRLAFALRSDGALAAPPLRIAAPDRWRPVLRWTRRGGGVRWDFEAVAFTQPPPRESVLVASVLARVRNESPSPHRVALEPSLVPFGESEAFVTWDAVAGPSSRRWGKEGTRDTVRAWCSGGTAAAGAARALAPGESAAYRFLFAAYPTAAPALERLAREPHARRVAQVQAEWDVRLAHGATFALGDTEVAAALAAARIVLLSCREQRGPRWVPTGGPFQYRDVWLRDGARLAHALAVAGHGPEALDAVRGLAALQWPNGAYLSQRGQLDGSGQALWAFEQVLLRAPDAAAADSFVEGGLRAWRWIEHQRAIGRSLAGPPGALLPFGDPRDNELVRAALVGNDAWAIAGERSLAHLLRARGSRALADSVEASLADYRATFRARLDALRTPDVPPSWQRSGRDWGNFAVGWPCGALPADDPRLAATARRAWALAGGAGLVTYGTRDSLHGYIGADLGTWALLAGRRAQADSVLAALLAWRTASGTAGELFARDGHVGRNLPPHPTTAAALVALVRNAVLFDDADTLRLTLGARAAWWRGARVAHAPTWWGPLDLSFERRGDRATWRWSAVPVWTALTLPPGTKLASPPPGPLVAGGRADVVLAPPGVTSASVVLASP